MCHSVHSALQIFPTVSADYPTFQSVPRHITNCLAHSLLFALHHFLNSITPRRSSFTCLLLALTVSGDKHTPAEQMTSLIIISPSQEFVFNIREMRQRDRMSLSTCQLSSTTSYHARLHWGEGLMHEHLFIKIKLISNVCRTRFQFYERLKD